MHFIVGSYVFGLFVCLSLACYILEGSVRFTLVAVMAAPPNWACQC